MLWWRLISSELSGFELAELPRAFLEEIEKHFRASVIKLNNPLDLGDLFDLSVYGQILEQTLQLENVDGVVFLHTASGPEIQTSRMLLERVMEMVKRYDKPIAYYVSTTAQEVNTLRQTYGFPIFTAVVETIRAMEMSYQHYSRMQKIRSAEEMPVYDVNQEAVQNLIAYARSRRARPAAFGIHAGSGVLWHPNSCRRSSCHVEEARLAAEAMGYPVAIKVISEQISHKSDVGGVQLNLRNGPAVEEAFADMLRRIHQFYPQVKLTVCWCNRWSLEGRS